jgi:hypothetical protein
MNSMAQTSPAKSSTDLRVRDQIRRRRTGIVVVTIVVIAALLIAWAGSGARRGYLDPAAYDGAGSHAVAALLAQNGVNVVTVRSSVDAAAQVRQAGARSTTLLVAVPDLLSADQVERLRAAGAATTILLAPTTRTTLSVWAPGVEPTARATDDVREPDCTWRAAVLAGGTRAGGAAYSVPPTIGIDPGLVQRCYPYRGDPTVVHLPNAAGNSRPIDNGDVTILGDPRVLTNDQLAKDGNAALALNALGQNTTLVWYLPTLAELTGGERKSFFTLVPRGVSFALLQLGVVVLLIAAWRVRRLGRVVVEPLPAVVRSSETVEGRGRMYRRAGARDRAAAALRDASIGRLRRRLTLPPNGTPDLLVAAVASRCDRAAPAIRDLLYGAAPVDDAALVRLADDLDALEREVTQF